MVQPRLYLWSVILPTQALIKNKSKWKKKKEHKPIKKTLLYPKVKNNLPQQKKYRSQIICGGILKDIFSKKNAIKYGRSTGIILISIW